MLIQNQLHDAPDHGEVINRLLAGATSADLMVAFVKASGVNRLRSGIRKCLGAGASNKIRLLCTLDMDISDPSAIKQLVEMGVEVKVYNSARGCFHPKVWTFAGDSGETCIVGSANMTAGAMSTNTEISVLLNAAASAAAKDVFNSYWLGENAVDATIEMLDIWAEEKRQRKKLIRKFVRQDSFAPTRCIADIENYIESWIRIGVGDTVSSGGIRGRLWRGWYIIPDQGEIDDQLMRRLHEICKVIGAKKLDISPSSRSVELTRILQLVKEKLAGKKDKMSLRALFIRQEKNYLLKFNFAFHPAKANGLADKNTLQLTKAGLAFANANSDRARKSIYTRELSAYMYNGLEIYDFVDQLLNGVEYLSFDEFNYFVCHAYSMKELHIISRLVRCHRKLPDGAKAGIKNKYIELFNQHLESTAKSVRGNYEKKVRHTMSAFGWCENMRLTRGKEIILSRK